MMHREDFIGRFAKHKVAPNLLMLMMLLAGLVGIIKLNIQFFPTYSIDFVTVTVVWPGASAEDVERSVTIPIEQELKNLDYVKEMTSRASQGVAVIALEYEEGSDMGIALDQVKEKVGLVRNLPSDAEKPEISRVENLEPVAKLLLTGPSLQELRGLAYQMEQQLLQAGIAKITYDGLPDLEMSIEVSSETLQQLQRSIPQLAQTIGAVSQDVPSGIAGRDEVARELRSLGQRRDEKAFETVPITVNQQGEYVRLADVAEIELQPKVGTVTAYKADTPAIVMSLLRTEHADSLQSAKVLQQWYEVTAPTLPQGVSIEVFDENWSLIRDRIMLLLNNGGGGLILVILILFLFLNGRVAWWVTLGIPVSFAATLGLMYAFGGSINMVSLFALIMALGIIVDDAIVVGEDALSHYQTGESSLEAAEGGARRMFVPVMSSSLTTVAAFLPLMLVSGIMGTILFAIPFVIICVLIASLIECFLILPGHLRHSFKHLHHAQPSGFRLWWDVKFAAFRDGVFRPLSAWSLSHRSITIAGALAVLIILVGVIKGGHVRFTFFPSPDGVRVNANALFVSGSSQQQVQDYLELLEKSLLQTEKELVGDTQLIVHYVKYLGKAQVAMDRALSGEQYGMIAVELAQPDHRTVTNQQFIEAWKRNAPKQSGLDNLIISAPRGGPPGSDLDIRLSGADALTLKQAAEALATAYREYTGVYNIEDDLPYGREQWIFALNPTGESLGLTLSNVGAQIRGAFDGVLVQTFYQGNDEVEVRVRLPEAERNQLHSLQQLPIVTPQGALVRADDVLTFSVQRGLQVLRHTNGELAVNVRASVNNDLANANEIVAELKKDVLPELAQRYGIRYHFSGMQERQSETFVDMLLGAVIGLVMMYLILTWVFEAWSWPLAVMIAIPLGLSGAVLGHLLLGLDMTILSMFGFFGLSGIVVNDSIILVSRYKELKAKGMARQTALLEASCQRLRAVLLTSLTTIAGLIPLLFETSLQAQFLIPMAVSISFGLAYATMLILFVVPTLISILEGIGARLKANQAALVITRTDEV